MDIKYNIIFLSDWHCGSGLDAGAEADALVLKDRDNLPYIPGKTIKGLLRDAAMEILETENAFFKKEEVEKLFGKQSTKVGEKNIPSESGSAFFLNATMLKKEADAIISNNLASELYRNIASTRIDKRGLATEHSLRVKEVCMPVTLEGKIIDIEQDHKKVIESACQWVRHLGVNRNRGLGRCTFQIIN